MTDTAHPFTRAGLGQAPFRCKAVRTNWFSPPGFPEAAKPGGSCQYCGTGILYEFVIQSADGREFVVGSDCVRRTGAVVQGFREERLKLARHQRATKRLDRYTERTARWQAEAALKLPEFDATHPGLREQLAASADPFLQDLHRKLIGWGSLSEKQVVAAQNTFARQAEREADKARSQFFGAVKERLHVKATILAVRAHEFYGYPPRTNYWHLMRTPDGNVCVYSGNHIGDKGDVVSGKFTVKAHDEYQGTKQTKLCRPKLDEVPDREAILRERAEDAQFPHDEPKDHAYNDDMRRQS